MLKTNLPGRKKKKRNQRRHFSVIKVASLGVTQEDRHNLIRPQFSTVMTHLFSNSAQFSNVGFIGSVKCMRYAHSDGLFWQDALLEFSYSMLALLHAWEWNERIKWVILSRKNNLTTEKYGQMIMLHSFRTQSKWMLTTQTLSLTGENWKKRNY